jgi:beta-galactosidase
MELRIATFRRIACALAILSTVALTAQQPLPEAPRKSALLLGAAWYPEQWPESRWEADLQLMQDAHIHFVRVGEFAWSTLEPREGDFQLDWLERAVRLAEKHGIAVVIGTPTAAPPAWLTQKYPETLRTMEDGRKAEHGGRQQFDWSDPKYRELCRLIALQLAMKFGHDPNVIGWQIDNEYKQESFGPTTDQQFQAWLKAKYKTLDNLNSVWTTSYWSETYQDWNQVPIEESKGNPGLMLNWKQFVSDTWRSYQANQLDAIRAHADRRQFITTNMMGWFHALDYYTVAQDLDLASWDSYIGTGHLNAARNGAIHDLTRGLLRKNFWVMETQPGSVNWSPDNNALDPGEVRAMAWNAVGHGAEAVAFWQWRAALNGQEQYHGTLIGTDGTPVPLYTEAQQIGADFEKASAALEGTTVQADVAILQDYPSRWALEWQPHNQAFNPVQDLMSFYKPLYAATRAVDIVADTAPLGRYKLVIAPALNVLTPAAAANLEQYVRGGGHLVLGTRSGMKDENNSLWPQRQPGPLADLLGARVEQFYALDKPVSFNGDWGSGEDSVWAERLEVKAPDVKVLMRYGPGTGWLANQPAAVTRAVRKGAITYIGANLDEPTMARATTWMLSESGVAAVLPGLPGTVDAAIRVGNGKRILVLTNYGADPVTISLPSPAEDVLHGGQVTQEMLPRFGVAVLRQPM